MRKWSTSHHSGIHAHSQQIYYNPKIFVTQEKWNQFCICFSTQKNKNANKLHTQRSHSQFSVLQQIFAAEIIQQQKKIHTHSFAAHTTRRSIISSNLFFFKCVFFFCSNPNSCDSKKMQQHKKSSLTPKKIIQTKCNPTLFLIWTPKEFNANQFISSPRIKSSPFLQQIVAPQIQKQIQRLDWIP